MDDDRDFKSRIDKTAKNYRLLKRADVFQRNRKNVRQELSYLKCMPQEEKNVILQSINGEIPNQLPPLSPYTISYYRRSSKPVFKTRAFQGGQLNAHMCYESLFILAGIEQMHFPNYQQVVKQFESELAQYINSPFPEIREMAMIAAGNKILGKEKQIERIVQIDPKQMWVIINHIYQRKISSSHLFKYLRDNNEIAFRSLFQMSNSNDDQIIESIMKHEEVLQVLIQNLRSYNIDIRKYTLRIIGNILAEKEDYVYILNKYNILNYLYEFLNENDNELRKDACWALSNFAVQKVPSTVLLQNVKLIEKLLFMLQNQKDNKIKVQLCHIFSCIVAFAQKPQVFSMIWKGHLLQRCGDFLQVQDPDLIHVSLYLMTKIIDLGDYFADEDGNCFVAEIKNLGLKSKITQKTYYTENNEISKLSSELQEKLEEDY